MAERLRSSCPRQTCRCWWTLWAGWSVWPSAWWWYLLLQQRYVNDRSLLSRLELIEPDRGWSANGIINYEVVLANGTVVSANAQENPDLYWALKGGAFNFGIVTRFDVETFSVPHLWGGSAYYNGSQLDPMVNAYASFAVASGGSSDPAAHSDPSIMYNVTSGELSIYSIYMYRGNDPAPAALKNFTDIPSTFNDFRVEETILGHRNDTNPPNFQEGTRRQLFSTTSLASSAEAVYLINQTYWDVMAANPQIRTVNDLQVTNTYQLFTAGMINAAKAKGGDPIGLEDPNGNGILGKHLATVSTITQLMN